MNEEEVSAGRRDEFSELARRQREQAQSEAERPVPDFISSVGPSEVSYSFEPSAIPLKYVDPTLLIDMMQEQYQASLAPTDLGPLVGAVGVEAVQAMSNTERVERSWRLSSADVKFVDGRLPLKYGFAGIAAIAINYERIFVSLDGITELAEAIVPEVQEMLWRAAGAERRYGDVQHLLRIIGYATTTRVDLGDRMMLSSAFQSFFEESFGQGGQFGGAMGTRSHRYQFKPSNDFFARISLDELHMQVDRFDPQTGSSYSGKVKFSCMSRDDRGTGRFRVVSHMPYADHVRFLEALMNALRPPS